MASLAEELLLGSLADTGVAGGPIVPDGRRTPTTPGLDGVAVTPVPVEGGLESFWGETDRDEVEEEEPTGPMDARDETVRVRGRDEGVGGGGPVPEAEEDGRD